MAFQKPTFPRAASLDIALSDLDGAPNSGFPAGALALCTSQLREGSVKEARLEVQL